MGWKSLPEWLKGGIIWTVIIIPLVIINSSGWVSDFFYDGAFNNFRYLLLILVMAPIYAVSIFGGSFVCVLPPFWYFCGSTLGRAVFPLVGAFVFGSIVGWIVGIINKRKKNNIKTYRLNE